MKIFGAIFALVSAQQFPAEWDTNDHFWIAAATESRNGAGGVAKVNNVRCNRSVNIRVSFSNLPIQRYSLGYFALY